jgi:hypothetical protein
MLIESPITNIRRFLLGLFRGEFDCRPVEKIHIIIVIIMLQVLLIQKLSIELHAVSVGFDLGHDLLKKVL